MLKKNSGITESEKLQNRFTAYLVTAIRRRRKDYLNQSHTHDRYMTEIEEDEYAGIPARETDMLSGLPVLMQIEDENLLHALKTMEDREQYVVLAHVLEERSFEALAGELEITASAVASIYYRAVQKLNKKMKETENGV